MLSLDYAKKIGNRYIMNFFADSIDDFKEVMNGKEYITRNGMNYGVPLPSSTIILTTPHNKKETYILDESGQWEEGCSSGGSGGGSAVQVDSISALPSLGNTGTVYFITDENAIYRWDEDGLRYVCVGRNYEEIKIINGGDANKEI